MNKRYFTGLMIAVLCVMPFATSALTGSDVQSRISELLAKIATLQAQIKNLQGQATVTTPSGTMPNAWGLKHRVCNVLDRSIAQGQTNDDVKSMQEFLKEEGYLNAEATGFFGSMTKEALIRWQASQGVVASPDARLAGAGMFGPKTKERIRIWCGGGVSGQKFTATPTRGDAPLTVSFNTWLSGFRVNTISYTIDYGDGSSERAADCPAPADACTGPGVNSHTYSSNGTYTATLNKITDPCPDDGDPNTPRCLAATHSEIIGKLQITVGPVACTKEYRPVCGSKPIVCVTTPCDPIPTTYGNKCEMTADGASFLYEGQCRSENPADDPQCKAWFDGCNSCARTNPGDPAACTLKYCAPNTAQKPYCTARFDTSANKAPVISGFSGPTTLSEDAEGTWSLKAKDPEGGELSYQVWWGDENIYASNYTTAVAAREFTQSVVFTHAYSNPGTYTVLITVRDSGGQEAKSSMTVKVSSGSSGVVCTAQYEPVCGRPTGCANTCQPGMMCPAICQLHDPVTYSNRCYLDAAKAELLYSGQCQQ
jgi:peptidoglycan hydrolase-like protein with peptidoglycan-binding domain